MVPSLLHEFKRFGNRPIDSRAKASVLVSQSSEFPDYDFDSEAPCVPREDRDTLAIIAWVAKRYARLDGWTLSKLTHLRDTPWSKVWDPQKESKIIPNDDIHKYYVNLVDEYHAAAK